MFVDVIGILGGLGRSARKLVVAGTENGNFNSSLTSLKMIFLYLLTSIVYILLLNDT